MRIGLPAFFMTSLLCSNVLADYCEYQRNESVTRDLTVVTSVELNALAGELDIQSQAANEIIVDGQICTDTEKYLQDIRLEAEMSGQTLIVTVIMPSRKMFWNPDYAYMNLEVKLPASMPIHIRDSSGDMILRGISATSINDSSGKIKGIDLKTDSRIDDSSGDIVIRGLAGSVTVTDSSGDIDLADVSGDVNIPSDGSGAIEISHAGGHVQVGRDGSGDIDIDEAGNDVSIDSDGSGNVRISHVKGQVHIGAKGSGDVKISDVSGDFLIDAKGSGNIRTKRIQGKISSSR